MDSDQLIKNNKINKLYLDIALRISEMSYAKRKKVGAVLVKEDNIISFGWNGTPKGFDNNCEDENNDTIPEVIHAEPNIISKAARLGINTSDSILYLTLSPCFECSKLIIQSNIKKVIYIEQYRDTRPLDFLKKAGIECLQYKL
jgi:dCMP deaminase